ncbi:MAG: ATP-binding protein [Phycisphaerae bacterium]|nr:ATP-binding protein [Phycisphaerae bacterium]
MAFVLKNIWRKTLVTLRLSPLSLAEKCRLAFGFAIAFILIIALLLPYVWMGKLTQNAALDVGRAKSDRLLREHFGITEPVLVPLNDAGTALDTKTPEMIWIRFTKENEEKFTELPKSIQQMVQTLLEEKDREQMIHIQENEDAVNSQYVRIFRAGDNCISCHNPEGIAKAFARNEAIGVAVVRRPAEQFKRTSLMNFVWIIVAGLIGGTGAIIAFYIITQKVILHPIRQLRALANNVAEGNLDIRSAIKTRDEYEKLANAFNHMLDEIQAGQQRLRQANIQLDEKIAELSERNIELFKANKIKGEFLANISHEFRTPLNAIIGFAEIFREKPDIIKEEKGRRYAENIIAGGKNLLNMVNDLLDLAKTEAGKMKLHIDTVDLRFLCKSTVAAFSELTRRNKIKVKLNIEDNVPHLLTDGGKVQQILYNFLSNAVKFTPQNGRIGITVTMPDEKHVRIAVSDTGCGIAEEDQEKIFEKFRQADGSLTRERSGSGLGLAISRELAAMLAGAIGLESKSNEGSTFWLEIPVNLTSEKPQGTNSGNRQ